MYKKKLIFICYVDNNFLTSYFKTTVNSDTAGVENVDENVYGDKKENSVIYQYEEFEDFGELEESEDAGQNVTEQEVYAEVSGEAAEEVANKIT